MKLTYFDMHGGRGEAIRLALSIGGIAFEDVRLTFPEFGAKRKEMPYHRVPTLEVDGYLLTQSNTICRFVGKQAGLYPEDPWQAALCDETMDALEDLSHALVKTFGLKGDALKEARASYLESPLKIYLTQLAENLKKRGDYFADGRLTVADLKAFVFGNTIKKGVLDHIPTDLLKTHAPAFDAHHGRIGALESVKAYYANFA